MSSKNQDDETQRLLPSNGNGSASTSQQQQAQPSPPPPGSAQRNKFRRRSNTFSNVFGVEPHGSDPRIEPESSLRYYQIAGADVNPIEEERQFRRDSFSSIDTADMLDHRNSVVAPSPTVPMPRNQHGASASRYSRNSTFTSPSLVERWAKRQSSQAARQPLPRAHTTMEYNTIHDGLEGNDSFAIAVDDGSDEDDIDQHMTGRFIDINSDDEQVKSNPSSRRSSNASSLHDVCFPLESPLETDSQQGLKVWPDLKILQEFADEERTEMEATEHAMVNDVTGERTSSLTSERLNAARLNENDIQGRLRPHRIVPWQRGKDSMKKEQKKLYPTMEEKNTQFRFTYFREDLDATVHSVNISGLLQPGQSYGELFPPRYSELDYFESPSTVNASANQSSTAFNNNNNNKSSLSDKQTPEGSQPQSPRTESAAPFSKKRPSQASTRKDPTPFWLDVMNPTEEEMKVISRTFGIHPLTTEDIFHGETREKVELFRNYYLVCFRSIDTNWERERHREKERERERERSDNNNNNQVPPHRSMSNKSTNGQSTGILMRNGYQSVSNQEPRKRSDRESRSKNSKRPRRARANELRALNMYIVVFHEGVITFHFEPTPHPINVRRRARLLQDYITVSSDWVSYALIDDITDGFAPLIEAIEDEVNSIEDEILKMHSGDSSDSSDDESDDDYGGSSSSSSSASSMGTRVWKEKGDMLRRIGECRKRVMSLMRLLGSKADVIKGFAKRCNEQWQVAPRSEIGLFLGDIQDHIVTMVQSLNHYEKLLARSHSNYLAQINIDMTRVNNDMNDVLGRITVLGTIVLPMNIVTGLWGMNVLVPGQDRDSLYWFWGITASLFLFAIICYFFARRILKM